ncbi:hypothetical protein [Rugosimonospora africana]|uniref:Uncharacterized protein n=1 Tax=Rugosimonospora africana TaxID=556532 RepID=A0A8J3VWD1_9ACTN|nr:hypothetical protein [Rugosimonospora africana]GIH21627.1 hypothetical protein Raf01_97990 [Rugosimonospora africana]
MTDVQVEFVGGPLDGVTSSVRAMTTGRPPKLFAIDVIALGGGYASHDYQVGDALNAKGRWPYKYVGTRTD